ncbi:MAG: translation elongation factor Ts [Clostridiales bacterium]|nr:translation elongation factor Ts [Clostridiales bacterium]
MITADMVKKLRERTGAGMMNCKRALTDANGDIDKAIEILREKGLAAAAKKAGRIASEGLVETYLSPDGIYGSIVEVNCETDFVAKNDDFISFTKGIAKQAAYSKASNVDELLNEKYAEGEGTVKDALTGLISKLGENMNLRRFQRFAKEDNEILKDYIHGGGRIGVLVQLACKNTEGLDNVAKEIALQVAAASPQYITKDQVTSDVIEKEKEIYKAQAINSGKSEAIAEKMVNGRLQKYFKEVCLIEQLWIRDQDLTIKEYLDQKSKEMGAPISIKRFVRFEKGEGIEKKAEDFAAEVQAQINKA